MSDNACESRDRCNAIIFTFSKVLIPMSLFYSRYETEASDKQNPTDNDNEDSHYDATLTCPEGADDAPAYKAVLPRESCRAAPGTASDGPTPIPRASCRPAPRGSRGG